MKKVLAVLILLVMLSGSLKLESETIVVVSNSIDYSPELIAYLQEYFDVILITAADFYQFQGYQYFIILGGPDASEGIGDVVTDILSPEELAYVRTPGVSDLFAHIIGSKTYMILAGSDREGTHYAITTQKEKILGFMPKEQIMWLEDLYFHRVTDMDITDLDSDTRYDFVYGVHKIVSDPWDRGAIYVYEDGDLQWYYHLTAIIKALKCYDLDSDGIKEIIVACDIVPDMGDLYVFDNRGHLKWKVRVPGSPRSLYCYETYVGVNLYEQGERVMIFDSAGRKINDLPINGSISRFEIKDINDDDEYELIVSGIVSHTWEHFLVVYDLYGNVLWNYQTWEHINDFLFYDIDDDGILETILGSYDALYITRGGDLLGKVELPPPLLHVEIYEDGLLVVNRYTAFLIKFSEIVNLQGETISLADFPFIVDSALRMHVKPEFIFFEDLDFDNVNEIITGDGKILEIHEQSEFVPLAEVIPTAPLEEAEEIPEEEIVYQVSICEVQLVIPAGEEGNLNAEWVKICNDGATALDLTGWVLVNSVGYFYNFPDGFTLEAGASVTVYTGSGEDTDTELYWGNSSEVWNNAGDTVELEDSEGNVVVSYEWTPA